MKTRWLKRNGLLYPVTDKRQPGESNPLIQCACGCGQTRRKYDRNGVPCRYINGHNNARSKP